MSYHFFIYSLQYINLYKFDIKLFEVPMGAYVDVCLHCRCGRVLGAERWLLSHLSEHRGLILLLVLGGPSALS